MVLPDTQHADVNMSGKDLPENGSPLKADIADIECIQDPSPL